MPFHALKPNRARHIYQLYAISFANLKKIYLCTVDLQCCVSFRCIAMWFTCTYIYIYFFQILFPYRLLQNIEYSSLGYTVGPSWLSIKYIVMIYNVYMLFPNS